MEFHDINPDRLLGDRAMKATIFAMTWQSTIEPVILPRSNRKTPINMMLSIQAAQPDRAVSIASSSSAASRPVTRKPPELIFRCYVSRQQGT
jgi:hypothetical protein